MRASTILQLYQFIVEQQEKSDEKQRSYGLWPSLIAMPDSISILGIDYNIMAGLQIMLLLLDAAQKIHLPEFDQLQSRFNIALKNFISDTKKSQRIPGFVAFWPLIELSPKVWRHNFDPKNPVFKHIDIKNDVGNSALAAIYLMKTGQHVDHVIHYAKTLSEDIHEKGFFTFLPDQSGGIDAVDNLNILTSIQMLKKFHPHLINDQLLKNERKTLLRSRKLLKCNAVIYSMIYYRRLSQFLLAFSKSHYDGFSLFNRNDCNIAKEILLSEFQRHGYDTTEQCELFLSLNYLYSSRKNLKGKMWNQQERICDDLEKILSLPLDKMDRKRMGEYTSFIAKSAFINTVIYKQLVCWYSPAHAAASALLMEVLNR